MSQNIQILPVFIFNFNFYFQPLRPGEPLYAQVNREKKKNKQYDPSCSMGEMWNYNEQAQPKVSSVDVSTAQGGDSWV